jgi:hypothetical protein
MVVGGGLILVAAAWIVVTGLLARSQLTQVRTEVTQLRSALGRGDVDGARRIEHDLAGHAGRAHDLTTGPAWSLATHLPAGGNAVRSIRGIAEAAHALAGAPVTALVDARAELAPATLRQADGAIDLDRIAAAAPALRRADDVIEAQVASVQALPTRTGFSPIDHARADLLGELTGVMGSVHSADLATHLLPGMLGQNGVQRYFVAFQNEAEARGTGGLPGTFGILRANHGTLHFERFASDSTLDGVTSGAKLGRDFAQLYAAGDPAKRYVDSNLSPNFPYAAQIWVSMWERHTGERLDGAVALDPTALSYLLAVTGPTTLPDGTKLNSENVVELTENRAYTRFGDRVAARRAFLREVASAAADQILAQHGSASDLVGALRQAAGERRALVWSSSPELKLLIDQTDLAGEVPRTAEPYAGLSIVNDGGDKLDYYLDRKVDWAATGCGTSRRVTVTITLTNSAPVGLPPSVTARSDQRGYRIQPGDNRLEVSWFGTQGGSLDRASLDGKADTAQSGFERGHPVYTVDVELPRGSTRTLVLDLSEPGGTQEPIQLDQPLVRTPQITVEPAHCR